MMFLYVQIIVTELFVDNNDCAILIQRASKKKSPKKIKTTD